MITLQVMSVKQNLIVVTRGNWLDLSQLGVKEMVTGVDLVHYAKVWTDGVLLRICRCG